MQLRRKSRRRCAYWVRRGRADDGGGANQSSYRGAFTATGPGNSPRLRGPWRDAARKWIIHFLAHFDLCRVDLVFRMSRASLLARLPLYCSAECATPTNSSLFANFPRSLANAPFPPESFRACIVCATHAHFCPQHWLLCHLGLY